MRTEAKTAVGLALILLFAGTATAGWWDSGWNYRKEVSVTNSHGNDLSEFPANFSLNTENLINQGKLQSDCSDIRVVSERPTEKVTEYNVTDCGTSDSKIFFTANVSSGSTTTDYNVYYGNLQASDKQEKVDTRIVNGKGQRGDFSYWCTHPGEGQGAGYDGFWGGKACNGSANGIGNSEYTGFKAFNRVGNGDWLNSPVSGRPVLSWGEDDSVVDQVDTASAGYQGFIAYKGYPGPQEGTLGVEVPGGVNAHAWFRLAVGSCDASTHGLTLYAGTNSTISDAPEGAVAGWMAGDGVKGVNKDEVANEVFDICDNEKRDTTSIIDPNSSYIYPYVDTFTRGPQDDAIAQIDDFYWSDNQGNEININTDTGPEEVLFTINNVTTYRAGKPRTFYAENETAHIEIRGEKFKAKPQIGIINPENNLSANLIETTNSSGVYEYDHEMAGPKGWYDLGIQPLTSAEKYEEGSDWQTGELTNLTASGGEIKIDYEDKSESGTFESNGGEWKNISFTNLYTDPVVFASVNTENTNQRPNLVKIRNLTSNGLQAKFCEPDSSDGCASHSTNETIGWSVAERSELDDLEGVEAGKIQLTADDSSSARTINLNESFSSSASVIAEQTTYNSPGESIVQVVNPTTGSFDIYLCDHDGSDGCETHPSENVSWIAIDPSADLPNFMEAGKTSPIGDSGVEAQSFSKFTSTPVIAATTNTNSGNQQSKPVRINSVTKDSANVGYCEHDTPDTCDNHNEEEVAWLATAEGVREPRKNAEYSSGLIDADKRVYWHSFSVNKTVPNQTELNITFYTNKTGSWEDYENLSNVPSSRYLKFKISMRGNGTATPTVENLEVKYNGPRDYGIIKENIFYRGKTWKNNYTDAEGNKYTFRKPVNVSEPGTMDRWMKPIEKRIDFEFQPEKNSVRILAWNGSRMLEIPVQVSDANISSDTVESADLTFFTSLEKSGKRQYYMVSTRAEYRKNYTGLKGSANRLENSFYTASFNQSYGGLMEDVKNFEGLGEYVAGIRPVDYYPEVDVPSGLEVDTKKARIDSTSNVNFTRNSLSSTVEVSGNLDGSEGYPYTLRCTSYYGKAYMTCKKNLTTLVGENWRDLQLNGLVFADGRFSNVTYDTGTQVISSDLKGDDFEAGDVTNSMNWVSFYSTRTGDAVAELFLNQSHEVKENAHFRISDGSLNDFFQHVIVDSSTQVTEGDSFYTETARVFYDGKKGHKKVDRVYRSLSNDLTVDLGVSETNDKSKPENKNFYNVSSSDQNILTVKTRWKDDTFLKSAETIIRMNTEHGENQTVLNKTISMRENSSFVPERWLNLTLNASEVNAGEVWAQINVSDVSGKETSKKHSFNVSDETAPAIRDITTSPSGINGLDPNRTVNVTANLTEFSNMSEASLYYRTSSSNWTKGGLELNKSNIFNFTYRGNFTPANSSIYEFKVNGTDTRNNSFESDVRELNISFDHTWNISSDLQEIVTTYSEVKKSGTLNITNLGDFNKTFSLGAGIYNSRTLLNGSALPRDVKVESGSTKSFIVNASGREEGSVEGTDNFEITVKNETANPDNLTRNFNVITSTGGPFLYITVPEYPAGVTQGDKKQNITAKVVNKGNESASEVYIDIKPPEKWEVSEGSTFNSEMTFSLDVGETKKFSALADIGSKASTGDQQIEIKATSVNETRYETVTVEVQQKSENNTKVIEEGGGGAPSGQQTGPTREEQIQGASSQIFNSTESFELVRGQDQNFTFQFSNPTSYNLSNISIEASGFRAQYLDLKTEYIKSLDVNNSRNITVAITAPDFFASSSFDIDFDISGKGYDSEAFVDPYFNFTLNKQVNLRIHEISRSNAENLTEQMQDLQKDLNRSGLSDREVNEIISEAGENIKQGEYGAVQEQFQQAQNIYQTATETKEGLNQLEENIESAQSRGLTVSQARRMMNLAEAALERGAYQTAANRLEEARNLYQLETKGQVNYVYLVKSNWKKILAALIVVSIISVVAYYRYRLYRINSRLERIDQEEESIHEMKIEDQKEAFEKGDMSIDEYEDAVEDYNEELVGLIEERTELESKKANLTNFREEDSLKQQKEQLKDIIRRTQEDYVEGDIADTEMYETKVEELTERLSSIESELAEIEAKSNSEKSRIPFR